MKLLCLFMGTLLIIGCATKRETYAPDGRKAYALNCSGLARGWDKCQTAAGELCGAAGYDILDRVSEDMAASGASATPTSFSAAGAKSNERSMLIACRTK